MNITNQIDLCFLSLSSQAYMFLTWVYLVLLTQEWLSKEKTGRSAWPTWSASEYHFECWRRKWMLSLLMTWHEILSVIRGGYHHLHILMMMTISPAQHRLLLFPAPTSLSWSGRSQWYFPDLKIILKRSKWYFWKPDYSTKKIKWFCLNPILFPNIQIIL